MTFLCSRLRVSLVVAVLWHSLVMAFQSGPQYPSSEALTDPVASLQKRLERHEIELKYEPKHGYLRSVLSQLGIPATSQALVFSKTSLQSELISPSTPRALYFNDDVYVGWIQNAPMLEVASVDPQYGTIFYVLDQKENLSPEFKRLGQPCISCHAPARDDVPSPLLLMMSVGTAASGEAIGEFQLVTDRTPLAERWGGWYVSFSQPGAAHRGNKVIGGGSERLLGDPSNGTRAFDPSLYLENTSDVVALMLLSHQVDVHNRISEASHQTRNLASDTPPSQIEAAVEPLVRALLFSEAAPVSDSVRGGTEFAKEFTAKGRKDRRGRSLKELDLNRRLLRYPLSYLVHSESFDHMPAIAREYVYRRLWEVFSGKDRSEQFAHLGNQDRSVLLEILSETKPEFQTWVRKK